MKGLLFLSSAIIVSALAVACGGDGTSGADAGTRSDSGSADSGTADSGATDSGLPGPTDGGHDGGALADASIEDASIDDAGSGGDAGTRSDAGPPADAGSPPTCDPALGSPCDEATGCAAGFECQVGRCAPQARDICGGFAGWTCPRTEGSPFTQCLYYTSADFGPCFTPAERECLCARFPSAFSCG